MNWHKQSVAALLAIPLAALSGCNSPSKAESGFNQIVANETTQARAIELMGSQPTRRRQTQLLNLLEVGVMEWQDDKYSFVLIVGAIPADGTEPRVLTKELHPRSVTTEN